MLNAIKITNVRKVGNETTAELSAIKQEAIAYAISVGTKASAGVAEATGWRLAASAAIAIQGDILATDGEEPGAVWDRRIKALQDHQEKVRAALRDSVLTQSIAEMGLARDVKAPRAKKGEDVIDAPQALMMKAEKRMDNYYSNRLIAAFKAKLLIKFDNGTNGDVLPESAGKLADRVKNAGRQAAPATGKSHLTGVFGKAQGDTTALLPDTFSIEQAKACENLIVGTSEIVRLVAAGVISIDDVMALGDNIREQAAQAAQEAGKNLILESMDDAEASDTQDEDETEDEEGVREANAVNA